MNQIRTLSGFYSLFILLLLTSQIIAQDGKLALFYDASCTEPSTVLPTVSLGLNTCMIPVGAYGLVIDSYPPCPNGGSASMIMYSDSICAQQAKAWLEDKCFWYFSMFSIPSIQFTCDQPSDNPQPTSTFTATATRIAGVATGAAGDSQGTGSATTSAAGNSAPTAGSTGTTESTGTSGSSSGNATSIGSSGLSTSDRIAIAVGLGVGIPSIVIALAAWLCPCAGRS